MAENQSVQIQCLSIEKLNLLIVSFLQKICRLFFGTASGALRESFGKASGALRDGFGCVSEKTRECLCSPFVLLRYCFGCHRTSPEQGHTKTIGVPEASPVHPSVIPEAGRCLIFLFILVYDNNPLFSTGHCHSIHIYNPANRYVCPVFHSCQPALARRPYIYTAP